MEYNHEAIYKAYPDVETITDNAPIVDKNGNTITLDQSKIDAAAIEVEKERYWIRRQVNYPPLEDFADAMYWNSKGDSSKLTEYYAACEKVKTDNPKPE